MNGFGRRAYVLLGVGVIAVPLIAAALAYGCTAAAILSSNPGAAAPGGAVAVTGKYFKTHASDSPGSAGPVQVRLGGVTGPVLATATPEGADRQFTVRIRVPSDAAAGDTLLVGTQYESDGRPVYGTPARQAFEITRPAPAAPGATPVAVGGPVAQLFGTERLATLTMAQARRLARAQVLRKNRRAKRIRTRCARRSRTTAVCRVRYRARGKTVARRIAVRSHSVAARAWW